MSYLDRVRFCQQWTPEDYRPFSIGEIRVGYIPHGLAGRLADFGTVFAVADNEIRLAAGLVDFDTRTNAVAEVLTRLAEAGDIGSLRNEPYPVLRRWHDVPLMTIDRRAAPVFGLRAFGVHLNGFVRRDDGLHMWVGRRSLNKPTGPGKLDHLVAGGQPYGLSIRENLIKESAEEASIPSDLAERAVAAGMVSYVCRFTDGLRDDVCFCYDLEVPQDFTPVNSDGEVEEFFLWPIEKVMQTLQEGDAFKFNVALVIIDFLVRHGHIAPDHSDYQEIVEGLRL